MEQKPHCTAANSIAAAAVDNNNSCVCKLWRCARMEATKTTATATFRRVTLDSECECARV